MPIELPEKFVRKTRWAYLKDNIEVGPYDANEIVALLEQREINPDTRVVEMNSRRMCPVREVQPFARAIVAVLDADKSRRSEEDFERTRSAVATRQRTLTVAIIIGVLVVVGGAIAAMVVFDPFSPKESQNKVIMDKSASSTSAEKVDVKEEESEPEFKIHEAEPGAEEETDESMVETVLEEQMMAPKSEELGKDEKLKGPAKLAPARKASSKPRPGNGGVAIELGEGSAGSGTDGIQTLDFTGDEDESGGSSVNLARQRLQKIIRQCVENSLQKFSGTDEIKVSATAMLHPDGRLKKLKLKVTPKKNVGELKMCISAELMRLRIPPFEGPTVPVTTQVTVGLEVLTP